MGVGCVSSSGLTGGVPTQFTEPANPLQTMKTASTAASAAVSALKSGDTAAASQALGSLSTALSKLGYCSQASTIDDAQKAVNSGKAISPAAQQLLSQFAAFNTASAAPTTGAQWGHSGVSAFG
jgi:hypothetical protein